jgi:hypothetical protein
MRLTKNQDLWGKVCAYISRGSGHASQTAGPGLPEAPAPDERRFAAEPNQALISSERRMEAWTC